jgi:5-methylthioribose kinase
MGNTVARLVDLERETDKLIQVYTEKRQVIISQIDSMEDMNFYDVLFHRYIEGKTFEAISEDIHYSWRQVMRIHDDALAAFEKKFGSCYMS